MAKQNISDSYVPTNNLASMGLIDAPDTSHFISLDDSDEVEEFELFDSSEALSEVLDDDKDPQETSKPSTNTGDVVSSVSKYKKLRELHNKKTEFYIKYADKTVEELLTVYKARKVANVELSWVRDEVFFRIFFLLPYVVKSTYHVSIDLFDDAMQNMSSSVLQAIDRFKPEKGSTFVNYLYGDFKAAIAKTFKDTNVVAIPASRRKVIKAVMRSEIGKPVADPDADMADGSLPEPVKTDLTGILTYEGIMYSDSHASNSCAIHQSEETLHNKQLVEWLEEALSMECGVLTADERRVLVLHYGLFGNKRKPYHEIAKLRAAEGKGCAYSRLSQIHSKAVKKLKDYFADMEIEEY